MYRNERLVVLHKAGLKPICMLQPLAKGLITAGAAADLCRPPDVGHTCRSNGTSAYSSSRRPDNALGATMLQQQPSSLVWNPQITSYTDDGNLDDHR